MIVAAIGGFIVLAWLALYTWVMNHLWYGDWVVDHRWIFPFICIPFSLLVGVLVKYFQAPTNIDGSMLDSLSGDASDIPWRRFPQTIAQTLASLFSGAVIGPEGGIGAISSQVGAFYNEKLKIPAQHRTRIVFGSVSSAYNGLLLNPVFTGVLGSEVQEQRQGKATMAANLLGGAVGYCIFLLLIGGNGLANYLHLPAVSAFRMLDVLYVILLSFIGTLLALILGVFFQVSAKFFGRFADRIILRALIAGVIFSIVGVFAPIILFSGETQIHTVVADPAKYGALLLIAMALGKIALLAVSFKSGFIGGPTFPAIFAVVCIAETLHIWIPDISLTILIAGMLPGLLMLIFQAPLVVILLTAFMLSANENLIALIVFSTAAALFANPYIQRSVAKRQTAAAAAAANTA